ncbi:MAG: ATP synthase F0 subunit B [Bacteriovoracaceae bacterium]
MKFLLLGNLFLAAGAASAAGKGAGSPLDLVPGFVNLTILLAFLIWVLKKPISNYFVGKSENVKSILERASVKAKEAEMMMNAQQKKINSVADEIDKILTDADQSVESFKSEFKTEVDERITKMKEDAALKIEAEKKEQLNKLNNSFLDEVIARAKTHIRENPESRTNATDKALEGLRK